jgi:hypothetical protein
MYKIMPLIFFDQCDRVSPAYPARPCEFEMDGRTSADGRGEGWGITRLGVEGGEDGGRGHGLTCGCPLPLNR